MHNIGWLVTDNEGETDGMGSRFFEIQNLASFGVSVAGMESVRYEEDLSGRLKIEVEGEKEIEIEELERIEVHFKGEGGVEIIGWGAKEWKDLPIGSTLDSNKGIFYWMPGPGFLGRHVLHFAVTDGQCRSKPVKVIVNIVPKKYCIEKNPKEIIKKGKLK